MNYKRGKKETTMPEKHARREKKLLCEVERTRQLDIRMKMERKNRYCTIHVLYEEKSCLRIKLRDSEAKMNGEGLDKGDLEAKDVSYLNCTSSYNMICSL